MDKPTLLLTRPPASSERFVSELPLPILDRVNTVISPLIEIVPTGAQVELPDGAGVIFSSSHGVENAPDGEGRVALCVGQRTAQVARSRGWDVVLVAQDAASLVAQCEPDGLPGQLVHLSGRHRRGHIAAGLTAKSIPTRQITLYDQVLCPLTEQAKATLAGMGRVIVPLFSPRTAAHFADQVGKTANLHVVALSWAVADALDGMKPERCVVVDAPTGNHMKQSIEKLVF